MKIAIVATIEECIPPQKYGGVERIVFEVAKGFGQKGHQIDLYASGDSEKSHYYNLIPIIEKSIRFTPEIYSDSSVSNTVKFLAYEKAATEIAKKDYDIVHNHTGWRFLVFSPFIKTQIFSTLHGSLHHKAHQVVYKKHSSTSFISISNNQRKGCPDINYVGTVYNGTNTQDYPFNGYVEPTAPMVFLARFVKEKGGLEAIRVAKETNKKIIVASKVDAIDHDYLEQVKPYIDETTVEFIGEITLEKKSNYLASSRCLLLPIQWEEPFGLMFTESMSAGTPVISYARGSAPEIVVDGVTGFLVNESEELRRGDYLVKRTGIEGLCEAVEKVYAMNGQDYRTMRLNCKLHVEKHFSHIRMVDGYESLFEKKLS